MPSGSVAATAPAAGAAPRRGRGLAVVFGVAVALGLAELPFAEFLADDLLQLAVLEHVSPDTWTGPAELYDISDGDPAHVAAMKDAGAFPWFFDPGFKMRFLRPVGSLLLAADHAMFGLRPAGYRAHSLLWFLLLVAGAGLLLRRELPGAAGTLALALYVLAGAHGNLFWIATRHIVVAGGIGILSTLAWIRYREEDWRPGVGWALAGFALAFAAGEAATGAIAYLLAWEALAAPGSARARLRAVTPVLVLGAAYLALHRALDLGATGSRYFDPLRDPAAWLTAVPVRFLALCGAMVGGYPADLWLLLPDARPGMAIAGALLLALSAWLLRRLWPALPEPRRRAVRWLGAGSLLALVPFAGSPIGARCLVVPLVGGAAVLAVVLHGWWTVLRSQRGATARLAGAACACLALVHLGLGPLQRVAMPHLLRQALGQHRAAAMRDAEIGDDLADKTVVVLYAPDMAVGLHGYFHRRLYRMPMPAAWRTISWAPHTHRYTRTDDRTLELEIVGGALDAGELQRGRRRSLRGMSATVLEADHVGPRRVALEFDRPLDDPSLRFLGWRDGRLRRVDAPRPGESLRFDWDPAPSR